MGGDNSTGSGGSWEIQENIIVCADTTNGASELVSEVVSILQNAGKNVTSGGVGPSTENYNVRGKTNTTIFWIVNGVDRWMCSEFDMECGDDKYWKGPWGNATHCNIVVGFWTGGGGACNMSNINNGSIGVHDGGWATQAIKNNAASDSADVIMRRNSPPNGWVAGPDATSLANSFLTGKGSGGGTSATVQAGILDAGRGTTPQFWNVENYTTPEEIVFKNFEIIDENPRVMTASFDSPVKIDLTSGRVGVFITGEVNDFGGIILKREYDSNNKIYKYQCQGFMDRIMANPIYAVCDGSKTVHRIIQEVLDGCGLPDVNLLDEDEYDTAVDEQTRYLMELDKDLTETSDIYTSQEDFTADKTKDGVSIDDGDDSTEDEKVIKTVTQTESSNEDNTIRNPFKKKPTGIYDCDTKGDFIRTLIFDYGLNVDFYGDINGIPHFDILDLDTWKRQGWAVSADTGFNSDYQSSMDITNIITQVGIKNIQASNGEGELYTSEELLGVNLENYVGRMGTIEENPSGDVTVNQNANEEDEVNQLNKVYQDTSGKTYAQTETFSTNGEPGCKFCANKNGGLQPTMQKYKKTWYNQCPACKEKNCLEDKSTGTDYKTVCKKCNKEYCQYCGTDKTNGNHVLIELFESFDKSDTTKSESSGDT